MKFQDRGATIQLLRPGGQTQGAARSTVVGSIRKSNLEISDELRAKLSPRELETVRMHVAKLRSIKAAEREYFASQFSGIVNTVAEWLETVDEATAKEFAEETRSALGKLRRHITSIEKLN